MKTTLNKNYLIMEAHWQHSQNMRANTEYLAMKVTGNCDGCGEDLGNFNPIELHANFAYDKFLCDDCYELHIQR